LHPVLKGFPRRKGRDGFGWNLDGLACAGVAAGPRLTVAHLETAKAAQIDRLTCLHGGDNGLQTLREHGVGLGL